MQKKLEFTTSSDSSNLTLSGNDNCSAPVVSCDMCDNRTKTENGMKRKKYEASQIDGNYSISEENGQEETFREQGEDTVKNNNLDIDNTVIVTNEIDGSKVTTN